MHELMNRKERTEQKISKLEARTIEITQALQQRKYNYTEKWKKFLDPVGL